MLAPAPMYGWGALLIDGFVPALTADIIVYLTLIALWSARTGWDARHCLAIGAGALLTCAWHSFAETPTGGAAMAVDLIGNTVFSVGALALVVWAWRSTTDSRQLP